MWGTSRKKNLAFRLLRFRSRTLGCIRYHARPLSSAALRKRGHTVRARSIIRSKKAIMAPRRGRTPKADTALQQAVRGARLDAKHKGVSTAEIRALTKLASEKAAEDANDSEEDACSDHGAPEPYVYDGPNPRFRDDSKALMLRDLRATGIDRIGYPRPNARAGDAWFAEAGVPSRHRYQQQQQWQAGPRLGYPGLYCPRPGAEPPRNPRDELLRELYVVGQARFGHSLAATIVASSSGAIEARSQAVTNR